VEVGEGYSSPVVSGGRAFVHSRKDPEEVVTAIDLANGKIRWEQKYAAPFQKNPYALRMAKGPYSTPLIFGGRLFTLGGAGLLKSWDAESGRQLWSRDFSTAVVTTNLFCGTAASPLVADGRLIVQVGSDLHGGQILALDPATGSTVWEWRGPGPGYASPVVIDVAGQSQLVALTEKSIVGLDARTGRELWSIPFPDEWQENIVTPLWTGSQLVVSGVRQNTHAFALAQTNGVWRAVPAWKNADVAMYMSSPVYGDGLIYGHSKKQRCQFVALDASTGTIRWTSEGREGDHASVLLTPRHVTYLTKDGNLIAARRGATTFTVEHRYKLADGDIWATPVFVGGDILIRNADSLIRFAPNQAKEQTRTR
jgi:outer membrane protein assembly factor BamB